ASVGADRISRASRRCRGATERSRLAQTRGSPRVDILSCPDSDPHPQPLPTRGRGADRACGTLVQRSQEHQHATLTSHERLQLTEPVDPARTSFDFAAAAYYSAFVKRSQRARQTQFAPSPSQTPACRGLVTFKFAGSGQARSRLGEGWGGGWCGGCTDLAPHNDPHPYPSPQGGPA